jgi:DNA-damage-inducible protein D
MSVIKIFENKRVRSQYDADNEIWYFSIVDIVGILTEQPTTERARNYWKVLKSRLIKEGNETVTNCNQLKLEAEDGKLRL